MTSLVNVKIKPEFTQYWSQQSGFLIWF